MTDNVSIWTSFVAGVASFLSPCVLPLVPGYISYVSGLSLDELSNSQDQGATMRKTLGGAALFVIGFSIVFTALGASASAVGRILLGNLPIINKIAGALIVIFGLHTMGVIRIPFLYYEKRFHTSGQAVRWFSPLVMGFAFAFGWTPCIGPILAGILALAATQETVFQGTLLLFIYSMGLGIPFLLTALGVQYFMRFFAKYKKFIRWGEIFAGILLVFVGVLIFTNKLTVLIKFLPDSLSKFAI